MGTIYNHGNIYSGGGGSSSEVSSFNGRSGTVLPIVGDYDSDKILLSSIMHIGGGTQNNVTEALSALNNGGGTSIEIPVPISKGGTGNTAGYIRTGQKSGSTIGTKATVEGYENVASGEYSHAEGVDTIAAGAYSHAGGKNNTAGYEAQTVVGKYNDNKSNTLFEVGNGTSATRSNALEVYNSGTLGIKGSLVQNGITQNIAPLLRFGYDATSTTGNRNNVKSKPYINSTSDWGIIGSLDEYKLITGDTVPSSSVFVTSSISISNSKLTITVPGNSGGNECWGYSGIYYKYPIYAKNIESIRAILNPVAATINGSDYRFLTQAYMIATNYPYYKDLDNAEDPTKIRRAFSMPLWYAEDSATTTISLAQPNHDISQLSGGVFYLVIKIQTWQNSGHTSISFTISDFETETTGDRDRVILKSDNSKFIKFGIDGNGNYGYYKDGADTVTPFKTGPDITDATAVQSEILNGKTAYIASGKVTGNMTNRGAVSATINPGGSYTIPAGYHNGSGTVTANNANLQTKTTNVKPSANWSGQNTNNATINPDSGYAGMSQVNVSVPMLRDHTLLTVNGVETPGTVYNGDTSQSNSTKMLQVAPTKDGMSYTNSYLNLGPSSYMGNAAASDVRSGKTFSSSNGIQVTGTMVTQSASSETISSAKTYNAGYYPNAWTVTPDSELKAVSEVVGGTIPDYQTKTITTGYKPAYIVICPASISSSYYYNGVRYDYDSTTMVYIRNNSSSGYYEIYYCNNSEGSAEHENGYCDINDSKPTNIMITEVTDTSFTIRWRHGAKLVMAVPFYLL